MTTDFRALCAELLQGLDENRHPEVRYPGHLRLVMTRARAALAEPEPVGRPVWSEGICGDGAAILKDGVMQPIEEVIAALNATALTAPEPVEPTNEELVTHYNRAVTSAIAIRVAVRNLINEDVDTATAAGLRAILARWGTPNLAQVRSSLGDGPSDAELLELMPQQFQADLATVSRLAAHGTSPDVTPGLFRVSLNTGALGYARAVLTRWGRQPASNA